MKKDTYGITEDTPITDELVMSICLYDNKRKMKSVVNSKKWLNDHKLISDYILSRYDADNIAECLYRIVNNIEIRPLCTVCGGRSTFRKFKDGFPRCCSTTCLNKDFEHITKTLSDRNPIITPILDKLDTLEN